MTYFIVLGECGPCDLKPPFDDNGPPILVFSGIAHLFLSKADATKAIYDTAINIQRRGYKDKRGGFCVMPAVSPELPTQLDHFSSEQLENDTERLDSTP